MGLRQPPDRCGGRGDRCGSRTRRRVTTRRCTRRGRLCTRRGDVVRDPHAGARAARPGRGQVRSTTTRAWSDWPAGRPGWVALIAVDEGVGHPPRRIGEPSTKVDLEPAVRARSAGGSSPSRCSPARARASSPPCRKPWKAARSGRVTCGATSRTGRGRRRRRSVAHVQVPTSAVGTSSQSRALSRSGASQPRLVGVVRVVGLAPVGDVERPHPHPATGGPIARSAAAGSPYGGMSAKPASTSSSPNSSPQQRDAVPLVDPRHRDLVAERLETHQRQRVLARLGLLQAEDVDVVALEEGLDAVDAGAEGVGFQVADAHRSTLGKGSHAGRHGRITLCAGNPLQMRPPWWRFIRTHWSRELVPTCSTLSEMACVHIPI